MLSQKIKNSVLSAIIFSSFVTVGLLLGLYYKSKPAAPTISDFSLLTDREEWLFSKQARELNFIYFGYTHCPDVCPLALSVASDAFKKISNDDKNKLLFIFISVDPEHDTPQSAQQYAKQFFPDFVGATQTKNKIDELVRQIGASYIIEKDSKSYLGYSVAHTDRIFILNKKGELVDSISNPRNSDEILTKIKENM